jgi:hypothetical protein
MMAKFFTPSLGSKANGNVAVGQEAGHILLSGPQAQQEVMADPSRLCGRDVRLLSTQAARRETPFR